MTPIVDPVVRRIVTVVLAATVGAGWLVLASDTDALAQAAPSASVAKAKELTAMMKAKKLEAFAMRDAAGPNRFIAVICTPDVQILLVNAVYGRPTDIEYRLFQKDYTTAYRDLKTAVIASERFFVEDILGDGLVAVPAKNGLPDSTALDATTTVFEGPADPRKRNDKRMPADAYTKIFRETDQRYAQLLDVIVAELKKSGTLEPAGVLR